jgi:dihydropteroate synthase
LKIKNLELSSLGIINLTPDSFSDGGLFFENQKLAQNFSKIDSFDAFDFGAESTAPQNSEISFSTEKERIQKFLLPHIKLFNHKKISIDTYKIETIEWFLSQINFNDFQEVIWNDVSGQLDERALRVLQRYPSLSYVYSHNLVPKREQTSNHMNFVNQDLICSEVILYFQKSKAIFSKLKNKVYFDLCFGFSKTREQNFLLIKNFAKIFEQVDHASWILGISRKSFLRFDHNDPDLLLQTEILQSLVLQQIINSQTTSPDLRPCDFLVRLHNPLVYKTLTHFYNFFI